MRSFGRLAAVLLCLVFPDAPSLHAQSATTGALGGVVRDVASAAIAGASLDLIDGSGTVRHTTTDRVGEFLLDALPPGVYHLNIAANGFRTLRVEGATVSLGRTLRVDPILKPGSIVPMY